MLLVNKLLIMFAFAVCSSNTCTVEGGEKAKIKEEISLQQPQVEIEEEEVEQEEIIEVPSALDHEAWLQTSELTS